MIQTYLVTSNDGREMLIDDEAGGSIFPYQELAKILVSNGIRQYKIQMNETK